jgi:hypothetical protein
LFGFENGAFLREQALAKMERLQDKVDLIAKITTDLIAKHNARILSNQDFGELLEKILVRADPFTFTTPPQDIS